MPALDRCCIVCDKLFTPNKFASARQTVCPAPACRKIAKRTRQADWRARNPDYFTGPEHVERVRQWRRENPDWRKKQRDAQAARRAKSSPQAKSCNTPEPGKARLQDLAPDSQSAVLVGLVSLVSGSVLQDEVHEIFHECLRRGGDLLRPVSGGATPPSNINPNPIIPSTHGKISDRSRAVASPATSI